eukprot:jgi/Tetstr1/443741/TSEL_031729.t1
MKIKEGFRKGSNHQPHRLLKSGKATLSRAGQVMKRSTLMARHRDVHGPTYRAEPHLPKPRQTFSNALGRHAGSTFSATTARCV